MNNNTNSLSCHYEIFFFGKADLHRLLSSLSMAWKDLLSKIPCSSSIHNSIKDQKLDSGYIWVVDIGKH